MAFNSWEGTRDMLHPAAPQNALTMRKEVFFFPLTTFQYLYNNNFFYSFMLQSYPCRVRDSS